ncbi:uncharacterized protein LOC136752655 isoform X2 [Amia ocellicauda]|uniref:uncharacterized protein LOC136752655 isoform X2 n=1 Tax=Amia ocellicauda TaxID=2972642 RepID=UPI003464E5E9
MASGSDFTVTADRGSIVVALNAPAVTGSITMPVNINKSESEIQEINTCIAEHINQLIKALEARDELQTRKEINHMEQYMKQMSEFTQEIRKQNQLFDAKNTELSHLEQFIEDLVKKNDELHNRDQQELKKDMDMIRNTLLGIAGVLCVIAIEVAVFASMWLKKKGNKGRSCPQYVPDFETEENTAGTDEEMEPEYVMAEGSASGQYASYR